MPRTISIVVYPVVTLALICALLGSSPAIGRTPSLQDPSQNAAKVAAERAFKQGQELRGQGSPESLRRAIEKYEEAVLLFRSIGDRRGEAAVLNTIGQTYSAIGEQQKAIGYYNQALPLQRAVGDRSGEAKALNNIGLAYNSLGERQKALDYYSQALLIARALGERIGEAAILSNIGAVYDRLADKQKALDYYSQALPIARAVGDRNGEAKALENIGQVYSSLGDKQKALDHYNQALLLRRALGNRIPEATTLHNIASVYSDLGQKEKALDYFNQALLIRRAVGDHRGEAATLISMGAAYDSLGDKQKAVESYNQALPIMTALGDRRGAANMLHNVGNIYNSLGETQKAVEYYNQALPVWREAGDRPGEAVTLISIGATYDSLGETQKAVEFYNQGLAISKAIGDQRAEVETLIRIGVAYNWLSEKQKALELYNQALPITRAIGDRRSEAATLHNIGNIYNSLGDTEKALEYYNQALPIRRAVGDRAGEAVTLNNIGTIYGSRIENEKALEYYNQAYSILREVGDRRGEANALSNIGTAYYKLGEKQKALEYYNQALPIFLAVGDRFKEGRTLADIGGVYDGLGDKGRALEFYSQSLVIARAVGDWVGEAIRQYELMLLYRTSTSSFAVFNGKQAVNAFQQVRAKITGLDKELQRTFARGNEGPYRVLADLLIDSGRLPEAQQVLNLFKDQQFFDFNSDVRKQAQLLALTAHEGLIAERYEQATKPVEVIGRQLDEVRRRFGARQPSAEEAARLQQLRGQLKIALDEFLTFLKQTEAEFAQPATEKDKIGEIDDARELQTALRELSRQTGQKAVAVYTLVGDDNFRALLITADNITAASQPIKGDALNQKALQLWGLLQTDRYDPTPLAQELYSIVFKPIEAQLPKDTATILWSLDGNLRYLPMAALHDGKQYLIERYNHVVFTRADRQRLLRAVSPRWTGLGVGSSQAHTVELLGDKITFNALPGVTEELRVLFRQKGSPGGVLEGEVLPDASFTRATMLAALKQKRPLVHISSHFSFRPGDEARSFLLLGDGTAMTLEEMKQYTDLFAGVELLTLSACNTAAQQPGANGREVDGFAELAQRLGAGSVMATLWPVADNSTPWLMREFYQTRQSGKGLTKAEAFRRAQLALLNGTAQTKPLPEGQKGASSAVEIVITPDGKRNSASTRGAVVVVSEKDAPPFKRDEKKPFAHPYYWAPFILIGNWK